eukprot:4479105-Pleurochrysis_carterae.AAC.3
MLNFTSKAELRSSPESPTGSSSAGHEVARVQLRHDVTAGQHSRRQTWSLSHSRLATCHTHSHRHTVTSTYARS